MCQTCGPSDSSSPVGSSTSKSDCVCAANYWLDPTVPTPCVECGVANCRSPNELAKCSCFDAGVFPLSVSAFATSGLCTEATPCLVDGGGTLQLTGLYFSETMLVTVGGAPCVTLELNTALTSATCTLPRTVGGAMTIHIDGVIPAGLADPFVHFACPTGSTASGTGCAFDTLETLAPPKALCAQSLATATYGCNNDIITPEGTDADYLTTLMLILVPSLGVTVVVGLLFTIVVSTFTLCGSKALHGILRKIDFFGVQYFAEGAARRVTKTALGGFITFLFASSMVSFTVYALTTYVKDNEVVLKIPTTTNVLKAHPGLAFFDMHASIVVNGRFEAGSDVSAIVSGVERRGGTEAPTATMTTNAADDDTLTRTIEWRCSECRFTGAMMQLTVQLASNREFIRTAEWSVDSNSYLVEQRTFAHGFVHPANSTAAQIFTRRLSGLSGACGGGSATTAAVATAPVEPAVVITVQALPVYFHRDARATVRRPKVERLGLELGYSYETQSETCELEYWEQAQVDGDQAGPKVTLQVCTCVRLWSVSPAL